LTVCDADVKAMFMCVWNDAPAGSTDTSLNGMILRPDASIDCLLQINATRQLVLVLVLVVVVVVVVHRSVGGDEAGCTYGFRELDGVDVGGGQVVGEVHLHRAVLLAVNGWPTKETELDLETAAGDVRKQHLLGELHGRRGGNRGRRQGGETVGGHGGGGAR
jgi:hypothetical protein